MVDYKYLMRRQFSLEEAVAEDKPYKAIEILANDMKYLLDRIDEYEALLKQFAELCNDHLTNADQSD